jgi:hypothetical protein
VTVTVDPISIVAQPVVLSASTTVAPLDIDVSNPAPVAVDVSATTLSATVSDSLSVTVALPGPQGIQGPSTTTITRTTAHALSGHRAVTADNDGLATYASCDDPNQISRPVWLTTGAWGDGVPATLTTDGAVTEPTWNWTPGLPIWLGLNGALTQTIPEEAVFIRELGEVIDPQTIAFRPQLPIRKG